MDSVRYMSISSIQSDKQVVYIFDSQFWQWLMEWFWFQLSYGGITEEMAQIMILNGRITAELALRGEIVFVYTRV